MVSNDQREAKTFIPDQPITSSSQDRLDRFPFAKGLADQLMAYDDPSSLIIALYGSWGSGKSSLINLIAEELNNRANAGVDNAPIVVRFNPWHFTSIEHLISMFFQTIKTSIGSNDTSDLGKKIGLGLQVLGAVLNAGRISPLGGEYFSVGANIAHRAAVWIGGTRQKLPDDIKEELNEDLDNLGKRIIVFIDDIDRLERDTMLLMLRLIRLSADLRNTTYVLAFDPTVVVPILTESGTSSGDRISGRAYLEKIVQVGFYIPPPYESALQRMFTEELDKVIAPVPDAQWETERWGDLYLGGLRHFFRRPRDIVRYINGLRLHFPPMMDEVNPVDFVGLEAIRTFAPEAYSYIAQNKDLVLGPRIPGLTGTEDIPSVRDTLDNTFGKDDPNLSDHLRGVVLQLFPQLNRIYHNTSYGGDWEANWRQAKRICSREFFDRYFYLGIPREEISEAELSTILALANDRSSLTGRLRLLIREGRIAQFLEKWEDHIQEIPAKNVRTALFSIFDITDELPWGPQALLDIDPQMRVVRVASRILNRDLDQSTKLGIIYDLVKSSENLTSVVFFIGVFEDDPGEISLTRETFDQVKENLLQRIRESAHRKTLSKFPYWALILYRWRDWAGGIEEPRQYVSELVAEDEGLLDLLAGFVSPVVSTAGLYTTKKTARISQENISDFVELDSITERVQGIKDKRWDSLSDDQKEAVDAFLNQIVQP